MSNPNVQRVYDTLVAYQQRDDEKLRGLIHPEGEIYGAPGIINSGTYHGFEGFQKWILQWEEAWDELTYEVGEVVEVDESLLVVSAHVIGRGAGSGVEIDTTFGWLFQWEDDLLVRYQVHPTVDEAMDVAKELAGEPR